ncbi:MAG TPA: hypothetical protein VFP50_10915 [Anaeromyxobacteraceae bacterium]|nr:hypothetical protein [Anaeromyxobacteraceae bacterium]
MRLSRPRLIFRAALLGLLSAYMGWRAWSTQRSTQLPGLDPEAIRLFSRIALVEWILAALALATGAAALLALRQKPRAHSLHLGGTTRPEGGPDGPGGPGRPAA